jgi:cilia- and flagella-associated protein 57
VCNILSNSINVPKVLLIKGCNEIRFSNGGHLFAAVASTCLIHVYNFYTHECTERMQFIGHSQRVMCIDWFANDMGFTTCGLDGNIYFYDLYFGKEIGERNRD